MGNIVIHISLGLYQNNIKSEMSGMYIGTAKFLLRMVKIMFQWKRVVFHELIPYTDIDFPRLTMRQLKLRVSMLSDKPRRKQSCGSKKMHELSVL